MVFESLMAVVGKGMVGSVLGVGVTWGSGRILYKKYLAPQPLQEVLEERTGKKFSRSTLVSYKDMGNGVHVSKYKIPSGLSVRNMLELKPAIEDRLDCELHVWSEAKNFVFELSTNPIPKSLDYDPAMVTGLLEDYEMAMYLGKSRKGDVIFDFTNNATPHLLFGGPTGKGKSNLLNQGICGMVETYASERLQLVLIDLKDGVELGGYKNLPHVRAFYETTDEVMGGLELLLTELKRRNELFKRLGVKKLSQYNEESGEVLPRILIVADEFAQFSNIADNDTRKAIYKKWEEILQKGRSAGIHCILGTQVTDADVFPRQIKGNIDARFGFGFSDPQHSKMITGGTELTTLPDIMGRGLFKLGDRFTQTQTAKIEETTIHQLIEKYSVTKVEEPIVETKAEPIKATPTEKKPIYISESEITFLPIKRRKKEPPKPTPEPMVSVEVGNIEDLFISEDDLKPSNVG